MNDPPEKTDLPDDIAMGLLRLSLVDNPGTSTPVWLGIIPMPEHAAEPGRQSWHVDDRGERLDAHRGSHRIYAWQPRNGDAALEAGDNVVSIQSSPDASSSGAQEIKQAATRRTMNERPQRNGHEPRVAPGSNEQTASEAPGTNLTTLIKDAEALHATLSEAKSSLARLVSGLRRQRKQSRLLSETLRSLKQLKLTEVAE